MYRALLICVGLGSLGLWGCSSDKAGADNGNPPPTECVDISQLPTTPTISFRTDLMPIFGLSCIASSCHDPSAHKADLILGDPAACGPQGTSCYDPAAKWKYTFKQPLTDQLVGQVLGNLVNIPAKTVPTVARIKPGDPENSFLLDKITGKMNSKQYPGPCTNQDTTKSTTPCGTDMPLTSPGINFCTDGDPIDAQKAMAIAQWIAQGAVNN
jgi:hypothetical protein